MGSPPSTAQGLRFPGSAVSWHDGPPEHCSLHLRGRENGYRTPRAGGKIQGAKMIACLPGTGPGRWWALVKVVSVIPPIHRPPHTDLEFLSLRIIERGK